MNDSDIQPQSFSIRRSSFHGTRMPCYNYCISVIRNLNTASTSALVRDSTYNLRQTEKQQKSVRYYKHWHLSFMTGRKEFCSLWMTSFTFLIVNKHCEIIQMTTHGFVSATSFWYSLLADIPAGCRLHPSFIIQHTVDFPYKSVSISLWCHSYNQQRNVIWLNLQEWLIISTTQHALYKCI